MKSLIIKILGVGALTLTLAGVIESLNQSKSDRPPASEKRTPASDGTIVFNYKHNGKPLKLTFKGVTWEVALKEGANKCIDFYTDGKRAKVDEELYLDLIDVCVNPR